MTRGQGGGGSSGRDDGWRGGGRGGWRGDGRDGARGGPRTRPGHQGGVHKGTAPSTITVTEPRRAPIEAWYLLRERIRMRPACIPEVLARFYNYASIGGTYTAT